VNNCRFNIELNTVKKHSGQKRQAKEIDTHYSYARVRVFELNSHYGINSCGRVCFTQVDP
jgi:vacuolar-type H+-ATPase subunit B/Vma2